MAPLLLFSGLALDEAFFEHFFVAEPQIRDIGRAEAENVFEGAANFGEAEIDPDALKQLDESLGAFGQNGFRTCTVLVQAMIGQDINGPGACSMANDVKETAGFGFGRGEPGCYT